MKHLIPYSEKNDSWIKECAREIYQEILSQGREKRQDLLSWKYFNEENPKKKYDYLTKITDSKTGNDLHYPSQMRDISIIRPRLNYLIAKARRRNAGFSPITIDEGSKRRKLETMILQYQQIIDENVNAVYSALEGQYQELIVKQQHFDQLMNQDPQNEQIAQQQAQLKQQEQEIRLNFKLAENRLKRELVLGQQELEKVKLSQKYNYKDFQDQLAQKSLKQLYQMLEAKEESVLAFVNKLVTGKEYFLVDFDENMRKPIYKRIPCFQVFYPKDTDTRWVQDGIWVALKYKRNSEELIEEYGKYLTDDEVKRLSLSQNTNSDYMNSYPGNYATFDSEFEGTSTFYDQGIDVHVIYYKSSRKVGFKQTPNKHKPGKYFTHVMKEEDFGKDLRKGEKKDFRYVEDLYKTVIIADDIIIPLGKQKKVVRSVDRPSKIQLPVIGKTHNNISDKAYSLIWATKDIQELYSIVNFKQEFLIALAGVKGFIMDDSQRPDDMSRKEWTYYRKLGQGWIQTIKKGRKINNSFNQFGTYDDSLSESVAYLESIKEGLKQTVAFVTGVSDQSLGEVRPTDQVGTTRNSVAVTQLISEVLFGEHDVVEAKALSRLVTLYTRFYDTTDIGSYVNQDGTQDIFYMPRAILKESDFDVLVTNSPRDDQAYEELRSFIMTEYSKGTLPIQNVIKLLHSSNTLIDLEKKFEYYSEKAEELMAKRAQEQAQAESQSQMELERLKKSLEKDIKAMEAQIKQEGLEIEKAKLAYEQNNSNIQNALKEKELILNAKLKELELAAENQMEQKHLNEMIRSNVVNEILQSMQLGINDRFGEQKNEIEKQKVNQPKEHISDR